MLSSRFFIEPSQRFKFLDALRGIAAIFVMLMHFYSLVNEHAATKLSAFLDTTLRYGYVGVYIFFVLSGFVIAYNVSSERLSWNYFRRFFIRRSVRLDPPYWIALLLYIAILFGGRLITRSAGASLPSMQEILLNMSYLQAFFEAKPILPVAWTLCYEIQFYLIFVGLLKVLQDLHQRAGLTLFSYSSSLSYILFGGLFILSLTEAAGLTGVSIPGLFLVIWYSFFIGCLTYWTLNRQASSFSLYAAWILMTVFYWKGQNHDIWIPAVISAIIYLVGIRGHLYTLFSEQPFQYLGKISYSLYLTHWPIGLKFINFMAFLLGATFQSIPPLAVLAISSAISILFADLFYRTVELPVLRFSKRIALKPQPASALVLRAE